jgi:hypothetical protein
MGVPPEDSTIRIWDLGFPSGFWFLVSDFWFSAMLDLFDFFRLALSWIVGIYATIITFQSLWNWYIWLGSSDKYIALIRRYVLVHGLRLRFRAFWGDVIICLLLSVAFILLWRAHGRVEQLRVALESLRQPVKPPTWRMAQQH